MQQTEIQTYPNSAGWHVEHDDDLLYIITNERGSTLDGRFTTRTFAENHLASYLEGCAQTAEEIAAKSKPKAEVVKPEPMPEEKSIEYAKNPKEEVITEDASSEI